MLDHSTINRMFQVSSLCQKLLQRTKYSTNAEYFQKILPNFLISSAHPMFSFQDIFVHPFSYNLIYQFKKEMNKFIMPFLSIINILINIGGIISAFLFPPYVYGVLAISLAPLCLVTYIQLSKRKILLQKKEVLSMVLFGFLIILSVFFLTIGLAVLIYLEEVQNKHLQVNTIFNQLMWQQSDLKETDIYILSIGYYVGNVITLALYTREYYQMFWVNYVIHIFRYLKSKIHHLNETLLSHLPKIKVTKQLKKQKCCLCIEHYEEVQDVTKLNCGHIFHRDCIRLWVLRSNACPLCRKKVVFY